MKKTVLAFSAGAIVSILGLSSLHALPAIDIKTAFLRINHGRLKESLRPEPGTASAIGEMREILEGFQVIDLKNHYMDSESLSATGMWKRTYVLYFSKEQLPIFVGSEHNRVTSDKLTDLFALCQDKAGNWSDCTGEIFPRVEISDLLAPGAKMDPTVQGLLSFYYELPRKGTTIYLHVKYNDYALEPATEQAIQKNLRKLRKKKFPLVWDKGNRKMLLGK